MENNTSKFTNLESNVAGALCYILTPFSGIYFFLVEKEDKFVRFHAFQSILFGIAAILAYNIALSSVFLLIGILLVPVVSIAAIILYAYLMWQAYNGVAYELPILGKISKDQVNKK